MGGAISIQKIWSLRLLLVKWGAKKIELLLKKQSKVLLLLLEVLLAGGNIFMVYYYHPHTNNLHGIESNTGCSKTQRHLLKNIKI